MTLLLVAGLATCIGMIVGPALLYVWVRRDER